MLYMDPMVPLFHGKVYRMIQQITALAGQDVAASIKENFKANMRRIFNELRAKGVSQADIADKIGVDRSQFSRYMLGHLPRLSNLQKMLDAFNEYMPVDPEDLFRDPEKTKRDDSDGIRAFTKFIQSTLENAGYELKPKKKP